MADSFVVASKVKQKVKEAGLRTGGDYLDSLSKKIESLVQGSIDKVKADNSKKTLGAEDLQ